MDISMVLDFQILKNINGIYTPISKDKATSVSIGGYYFIINGQEIPFDWDAFVGNEENGIFSFETGYGFLFNDFKLSDCYEEAYKEIGLTMEEISAEFLAQASKICEVHVNFIDDEDDEVDLGFNDDEDYRINLLTMYFIDIETDKEYHVSKAVLDEYNNRNL